LRQRCPPLPVPSDASRAGVLLWGQQVIEAYDDCARRHDAAVDALGG
jgi:hypothetical protein